MSLKRRSSRTCRRIALAVTPALLIACGSPDPTAADGAIAYEGGRIVAPGCGYEVRTRYGATAPVVADVPGSATAAALRIRLGIAGANEDRGDERP